MHKMINAAVILAVIFAAVDAAPRPGYYGGGDDHHAELAHEYTEVIVNNYLYIIATLITIFSYEFPDYQTGCGSSIQTCVC